MFDTRSIKKKNILVIGDCMLDTYYEGSVERISPEAPVPVFKKKNERKALGGATNVAANLVAAGQDVSIAAIVGRDIAGNNLETLLRSNGIRTKFLLKSDRPTTEKIRFLAGNNQQVFRLDIEDTCPISHNEADDFIRAIELEIDMFDMILVSDYMKGLITEYFMQQLVNVSTHHHKRICVDVKDPRYSKYKGAYLLKPNKSELHALTSLPVENDEQVYEASEKLRKGCECEYVLTTCGVRGMLLTGENIRGAVDSVGREVFDVTGAGDTVIAYLASCLANGMEITDAVKISSVAAGIQVSKVGTSSVFLKEVAEYLTHGRRNVSHKLLNREEVKKLRAAYKGKKIVFTNGCFDIIHAGHVRYLQEAADMGDVLVLGLNSDESIKRIKGADRPVNNDSDRIEVLCNLSSVDYVVEFDEDTPYNLINDIQPDILVKGADYEDKEIVGSDIVMARKGKVKLIPFVPGKSTSNIINKIQNRS